MERSCRNDLTTKAAKRPYLLRQLKRAGISSDDLVQFYCSVIRSVLEYGCQVFHRSLPSYLSDEIERIQRRAMRTVFPVCKYSVTSERAGIPTLSVRRKSLCLDLFSNIVQDRNHTLADLLPPKSTHNRQLRSRRVFNIPVCKTDRYKNSLIISHSN